jgi:integrase
MEDLPRPGRPARRRSEGIQPRHARACASRRGSSCSCSPSYQAQVFSQRERKVIRKTFKTLAAAKAWRQDALVALRKGKMRSPTRTTLREAADQWLLGAKEGLIRTRSGDPYKPSALRSYEGALLTKALPALGHLRLSSVTRNSIQDLVDRLVAEGFAPSSVRNTVLPLRAIYRRALSRTEVAENPTLELSLPAVRKRRERVARPVEASALIEALPAVDRALWATALYAGLRRGELQALEWEQIDFAEGVIRVERSWDPVAGPIEPKSRAGRRRVPIPAALRRHLLAHRLRQGRPHGLVFGSARRGAFDPPSAIARAKAAWVKAGLSPVALHECRHTYASFMIAAGVNAKALSTYMGHSSITVTLDRYGHLMPGAEGEAALLLDAYLGRELGRASSRAS